MLWVYILFGVLDDAPGLIWVPGKGPVPVDPEWRTIALEQREVLLKELEAGLRTTGSPLTSREFDKAAQASLRDAVKQLGKRVGGQVVR